MSGRSRFGPAALGLLALLGGAGASLAGAQDGEAATGFVASASAAGVRASFAAPRFVVTDTLADAGGPVAEAVLDSVGSGRSFAALPYPGDLVLSMPGLLATGSGQSVPVSVPGYVAADHPSVPESAASDPAGAYRLAARAGADRAEGQARIGTPGAGEPRSAAESTTLIERTADGAVRATARSLIEGLSFGDGVLHLARVVSEATTVLRPGHDPSTAARLRIEGATVNGVGVAFTPEGIEALGNPVPLPPPTIAALSKALADAGLDVRIVKAATVIGGVQSDVLQITSTAALPAGPTGITTVRLGGAVAAVVAGGAGIPGTSDLPADVGLADGSGFGSGGAPDGPPAAAPTDGPFGRSAEPALPATGLGPGSAPAGGSATFAAPAGDGASVSSAPLTGSGDGRSGAVVPASTVSASAGWDAWRASKLLYLALITGALLVLVASRLWRAKEEEPWLTL